MVKIFVLHDKAASKVSMYTSIESLLIANQPLLSRNRVTKATIYKWSATQDKEPLLRSEFSVTKTYAYSSSDVRSSLSEGKIGAINGRKFQFFSWESEGIYDSLEEMYEANKGLIRFYNMSLETLKAWELADNAFIETKDFVIKKEWLAKKIESPWL